MPEKAPESTPVQEPPTSDDGSALPVSLRIEAAIFSTDRSLSDARLGDVVGIDSDGAASTIRAAIKELNDEYASTGRSFRIERLADGWQVLTQPEYAPVMARLHRQRQQSRLSQAALETLAIIAYRQPVMRAEIEAIRGVACGEVLRGLLERRMIRVTGRAEELGRPMLYGTTKEFLRLFGLAGLGDLPDVEGLDRSPSYRPSSPHPPPPSDEVGEPTPAVDHDADAPAEKASGDVEAREATGSSSPASTST